LNYELKNNDIVKINTNKSSTPSKEWINMVKSTTVRNKIKAFFTKNERDVYIERGKYSLEKELRKRKLVFSEFMSDENTKKICETLKVEDFDEVYLSIGNGKTTVGSVVNIIDKYEEVAAPKVVKITNKDIDADIIVSGIDKVKVNLANCCNPVYGDEIVGYITKGNGITVHRINCHNLEMLEDRTLEVKWNENSNKRYLTYMLIHTNDDKNHMLDIIQSVSMANISVDSLNTMSKGEKSIYELSCYVSGIDQLNHLILNLSKAKYIEKVERAIR
jgi:GTP pyrophosphokinase